MLPTRIMGIFRHVSEGAYLVVDAQDAGDPMRLEPLDALDVVHIVDQHDDMGSLDLAVSVLLLFSES